MLACHVEKGWDHRFPMVFGWRRVTITVELSVLEGRLALVVWPFFGL